MTEPSRKRARSEGELNEDKVDDAGDSAVVHFGLDPMEPCIQQPAFDLTSAPPACESEQTEPSCQVLPTFEAMPLQPSSEACEIKATQLYHHQELTVPVLPVKEAPEIKAIELAHLPAAFEEIPLLPAIEIKATEPYQLPTAFEGMPLLPACKNAPIELRQLPPNVEARPCHLQEMREETVSGLTNILPGTSSMLPTDIPSDKQRSLRQLPSEINVMLIPPGSESSPMECGGLSANLCEEAFPSEVSNISVGQSIVCGSETSVFAGQLGSFSNIISSLSVDDEMKGKSEAKLGNLPVDQLTKRETEIMGDQVKLVGLFPDVSNEEVGRSSSENLATIAVLAIEGSELGSFPDVLSTEVGGVHDDLISPNLSATTVRNVSVDEPVINESQTTNVPPTKLEFGHIPILNTTIKTLFESVECGFYSTVQREDLEDEAPPVNTAHFDSNAYKSPEFDFSSDEEDKEPQFKDLGEITVPDKELYRGAPLTLRESFVAILSFLESEHLSSQGLARLLGLIQLHLPQPNNFFKSSHVFLKMLQHQEEPVQVFYFCSICNRSRSGPNDLCNECQDKTRSVEHFISIPLVPQLRKICQRPGFLSDLNHKNTRVKQNPSNYEDIYDGSIYKEVERCFTGPGELVTLMWNTDGVQTFNSSSYSLWPFYFVILELPPAKRFRSENMILGGIWGSTTKPHPNIYLQSIYRDVKTIEKGIDVEFYDDKSVRKVSGRVVCGTGDAPAISLFLNLKFPSGYYSCFVCEIVGENSDATGNVTVFPFEADVTFRTMDRYEDQVLWAHRHKVIFHKDLVNNPQCCGVKGPTLLSSFVPDLFSCTSIDYMHCVCLGVMRQLLHLWFDHANREERFSVYDKNGVFNEKLMQLKMPHFVDRCPQLIDKLAYWKASELRNFLFYLALCVLKDVLNAEYFDHFMLFVEGVALLNSSSVSPEDVLQSNVLLTRFVKDFETLYGLRHMSSNVHKCQHLGLQVPNLAPLWALSCFPFEDMNGRLASLIHGSRFADLQIFERLSMITDLPLLIFSMPDGPAKDYCIKLHNKFMRLKLNGKIADHVYCVGKASALTDIWVSDELVKNGIVDEGKVGLVTVFHRLLKNGTLYIGNTYGRGERVSSFVLYRDSKFGNIECFVKVNDCECLVQCSCPKKHFAVIKPVRTSPAFRNDVMTVSHIFSCNLSEGCDVVPVLDLGAVLYKCAFSGADSFYLSKPLNRYEFE